VTEPIQVRKVQAFVPVTCCELTDATGVNHCNHPPPAPLPLWRRIRPRAAGWWTRLRFRVGSWIAGVSLDEECE